MATILLTIHLMIAVVLVALVLLQRSEGGALGIGGGGGLMTGRGAGNALTRATAIVAALFFAVSLTLGVMASRGGANKSLLDTIAPMPTGSDINVAPAPLTGPGATGPAVPAPAGAASDAAKNAAPAPVPAKPAEPSVPRAQ